ncbi:hypothetical protein [Phenylobacterium sp.]|jgi:hypothetical protein|uniref:hypothetical protein n=1 Tax=Phenylobacterium sp. TaxID=1871053 RepID=UPI002E334A3E|nr:hypothetical protein [Phenylobacterium sp.]HEX3365778.1 hypothetical protein [Phenylobacterium sp.]
MTGMPAPSAAKRRTPRKASSGALKIAGSDLSKTGKASRKATLQFGSASITVNRSTLEDRSRNISRGQDALKKLKPKLVTPGVKLRSRKGVPLFFADPARPGRIIRELDGRRESGVIENGTFKAKG